MKNAQVNKQQVWSKGYQELRLIFLFAPEQKYSKHHCKLKTKKSVIENFEQLTQLLVKGGCVQQMFS